MYWRARRRTLGRTTPHELRFRTNNARILHNPEIHSKDYIRTSLSATLCHSQSTLTTTTYAELEPPRFTVLSERQQSPLRADSVIILAECFLPTKGTAHFYSDLRDIFMYKRSSPQVQIRCMIDIINYDQGHSSDSEIHPVYVALQKCQDSEWP